MYQCYIMNPLKGNWEVITLPFHAQESQPNHFHVKNVTIYRASFHHFFDSVFSTGMVGVNYYPPHSTDKEIETENLHDLLKTTYLTSQSSLGENPCFMIQGSLFFVYTILPRSILLKLCYTNERRTVPSS